MRLSSNHPWPYDSSAGSPATDADEPKPESFVSSTPVPDPSNHGAVTIPNTAIENSFRKGLLSFSWTIHILAVGAAMAVVQFSLRSVYWFDEGANVDFVAKIHEALIWASLSAMVLHVVRRMLMCDGVSWGLLAGAYQFVSIGRPLSAGFWKPLCDPGRRHNLIFALALGIAVVYANLSSLAPLPLDAGTYRVLNATLEFAAENFVAVATTLHSSISSLPGLLWNYIKKHEVGQAKMAQSERPDTLIVPCMIDARWEGVATSLDPESDSIIPSNFTDLSALGPFWDRAPRRPLPAGLTHGNIPIPLEWAGLLNKKDYATGFNGSMSAMETLLDNFVRRGESAAWFTPPRFREAGDGSNDPSSPDSIRNDIARTVAAIASLVIADGMSRSAYMWEPGLVLRNSAGTNLWQLLWFQEGEESDPRNITDCDLGIWYPVYWEVHRPSSTAADSIDADPKLKAQAGDSTNTTLNETQITEALEGIANAFRQWPEAPIFHWPEEEGLEYESVTFPSEDGVPLEGWFFPCNGSDKVLIMNHPRLFNRAGLPSHIEPWNSLTAPAGNNIDVNFIPDYKILHDAGYNILTHDFRNYGLSGRANGVLYSGGRFESRDVIGAIRYIRKRKDTRNMTLGMFPRCMGGSATFYAMSRLPGEFEGIRVIVTPQPISANMSARVDLEQRGIPLSYIDDLDEMVFWRTSLHLDQFSPIPWARSVTIPTFIYQVRNDIHTRPDDVQAIYDAIPIAEKKLLWIENSTRRWDGYLHFQRQPEPMLDWLERYMNYYIKSLEDRVAQLELALRSQGVDIESVPESQTSQEAWGIPEIAPEAPGDSALLKLLVPDPQHMQDKTAPGYHALLDDFTVPNAVKYPPKTTAVQLAATYFEHSNFFSPILDEDHFSVTMDALYHDGSDPTHGTSEQRFQLCMVLAIAIRLLNRTDAAVPTTGSDSFFASAMIAFTERPRAIWKGNEEHLQHLLLIVQYTIFTSNLSAAWHFIGLATRLALDLSLHNETQCSRLEGQSESHSLSEVELNKRRRVFWSTYILETNLCVVLNRPRSIPDEAVFTPLPSTDGPESSSPLANHCMLFRQLEYEIFQTLNYKSPMNGAIFDYHAWKIGMRDRLVNWHSAVPPLDISSKLAPRNFFDGALYMTLVYLFSPSRHFPSLSECDLRDLATYASWSIELYRAGFKEGKLRFYWRTIPNLFRSGAALIHCIKNLALQGAAFDANELEKKVAMCSTVLWGMAERYPPGASYRDRFDELSASVSDVSVSAGGQSSGVLDELFLAQDPIAPLDLDDTATMWTKTPPNLDPWIFDHS
ncbi:hypothetical protein ACJ41O_015119 [Fusarium nematophilum]